MGLLSLVYIKWYITFAILIHKIVLSLYFKALIDHAADQPPGGTISNYSHG